MKRVRILQRIHESALIPVVRAESADQAKLIIDALLAGGVRAIEVTMTVPGALDVIRELAATMPADVVLGAGTVLDSETARLAILAGAQFVVSPALNTDVIRLCHRYQVPVLPGAFTPTEIVRAMEEGADLVKIFPAAELGVNYVKAIKAALPHAPIMPTGGVNLDNVADWIKAGCTAVGVGGELTAGARTGDYTRVTETARAFLERIESARC
ncbi:MAG: bifunctional 2-keto-4-hydroxyglutarate aldolase/2-keto-3-deoxy-6-phosphogluconate aldolase [Bacillota bacterium]